IGLIQVCSAGFSVAPAPGARSTAATTPAARMATRPRMNSSVPGPSRLQSPPVNDTVRFVQVGLWRSSQGVRKVILGGIDWTAGEGQHWGIVGPNGAGKTTLLRIASAQMRPSDGAAWVLGARLGRVPLHELRRRIGLVEPALGRRFYPEQRAVDVVLTGFAGSILLAEKVP